MSNLSWTKGNRRPYKATKIDVLAFIQDKEPVTVHDLIDENQPLFQGTPTPAHIKVIALRTKVLAEIHPTAQQPVLSLTSCLNFFAPTSSFIAKKLRDKVQWF